MIKQFETWRRHLGLEADYLQKHPDSFDGQIEFGTAGLRGIDGIGTNRINDYVIIRAATGLSLAVLKQGGSSMGISYDSRKNSRRYAYLSARVFAHHGIRVYITPGIMPTPYLAFCLREMGLGAGVMVTASHNPAEYSGYKVYSADGCQISGDYAAEVWDIIRQLGYFDNQIAPDNDADGLITDFPEHLPSAYEQQLKQGLTADFEGLKVCYTALNGAGADIVPRLLREHSAQTVTVAEQDIADPSFKTCPYPNPEKPEAFALAERYAHEGNCDIILATDPDADRIGAMYRTKGGYVLLSGDEIGVLITDHVLRTRQVPKDSIIVRTIVTMTLCDRIASAAGVRVVETYTGFKNICEPALKLIREGHPQKFILGYEESNGICVGTYALDKDGVFASLLLAEIAAQAKRQGKNFGDLLEDIYAKFGFMSGKTVSFRLEGREGKARIDSAMTALRSLKDECFCGYKVLRVRDFLQPQSGFSHTSDALVIDMQDDIRLCMRPSGTEPLLKIYMQCCQRDMLPVKRLQKHIEAMVKA